MNSNPQLLEMLANQRVAELRAEAFDRSATIGSRPIRRRMARTLRRLADWLEPALQGTVGVRIPAPRNPA